MKNIFSELPTDYQKIRKIGEQDAKVLEQKGREYGNSWCKSGGVSAYFMLKRKIDRLQNIVERGLTESDITNLLDTAEAIEQGTRLPGSEEATAALIRKAVQNRQYDILEIGANDTREEGLLDDIGDLRRYLLLVEERIRAVQEYRKATESRVGYQPETESSQTPPTPKTIYYVDNGREFGPSSFRPGEAKSTQEVTDSLVRATFATDATKRDNDPAAEKLLGEISKESILDALRVAHPAEDERLVPRKSSDHPAPFGFTGEDEG